MGIPLTFDTSELEAAVRQLAAETGKSIPSALNKKMGWLLRRWFWHMPATPGTKIISQLGLRMRRTKAGAWKRAGSKTFTRTGEAAPLIVAILQKRGSPYKGKTRKQGIQDFRALVRKVVGARVKSAGYLRSGVVEALKPFAPFASGGKLAPPKASDGKRIGKPKGFGVPAKSSGTNHFAVAIDATINKQRWSKRKKPEDEALRKIALPALQRAYREELADTREYLNKVLYDSARKVGISAKP